MQTFKKLMITTTLAGALALHPGQRIANADEPVTVATITAVGAIGVATITAIGALGVAAINGVSKIRAAEVEAEGNSSADGSQGDSASVNESQSISGSTGQNTSVSFELLPEDSRKWLLNYNRRLQLKSVKVDDETALLPSARFGFHGDVTRAPETVKEINYSQTVTMKLKVDTGDGSSEGNILLMVKDLTLSTTDVPGTLGLAKMTVVATSGGKETTKWEAIAPQGKDAAIDKAPGTDKAKLTNGKIWVDGIFVIPVGVIFPDQKSGEVTIKVTYEGFGRKT